MSHRPHVRPQHSSRHRSPNFHELSRQRRFMDLSLPEGLCHSGRAPTEVSSGRLALDYGDPGIPAWRQQHGGDSAPRGPGAQGPPQHPGGRPPARLQSGDFPQPGRVPVPPHASLQACTAQFSSPDAAPHVCREPLRSIRIIALAVYTPEGKRSEGFGLFLCSSVGPDDGGRPFCGWLPERGPLSRHCLHICI